MMTRLLHSFLAMTALIMAFVSTSAWAKGGNIGISTGMVFSSDSGTETLYRFGNPAALAGATRAVDVFGGYESSNNVDLMGFNGSFVGSGKSVGFGLGANYSSIEVANVSTTTTTAYGGLGFGSKSWSFGVGGAYNFDSESETLDATALFGSDRFRVALGAYDLTGNVITFGGGVGFRKPGSFRLEGGLTYNETTELGIDAGLAIELSSFELMGGYSADLDMIDDGTVRAGAHIWLGKKFGLNYRYQFGVDHTVGLRFLM